MLIAMPQASPPETIMVTADPERAAKTEPYIADDRAPWQRARELLDAGHPWPAVKQCMFADFRARITFANLLDDEDMADLAYVCFHTSVSEIEGTFISGEAMEAMLDELDRRDGLPPFAGNDQG